MMVVDNEPRSQPCLTIYYTNGETFEGLSWCESQLTQSWCVLLGPELKSSPRLTEKSGCGDGCGQ